MIYLVCICIYIGRTITLAIWTLSQANGPHINVYNFQVQEQKNIFSIYSIFKRIFVYYNITKLSPDVFKLLILTF